MTDGVSDPSGWGRRTARPEHNRGATEPSRSYAQGVQISLSSLSEDRLADEAFESAADLAAGLAFSSAAFDVCAGRGPKLILVRTMTS